MVLVYGPRQDMDTYLPFRCVFKAPQPNGERWWSRLFKRDQRGTWAEFKLSAPDEFELHKSLHVVYNPDFNNFNIFSSLTNAHILGFYGGGHSGAVIGRCFASQAVRAEKKLPCIGYRHWPTAIFITIGPHDFSVFMACLALSLDLKQIWRPPTTAAKPAESAGCLASLMCLEIPSV